MGTEVAMHYKLPLVFEPQPEGGYMVTSPAVPELLTEGDSIEDALDNVRDALAAVFEIYRDLGKSLPSEMAAVEIGKELRVDLLVAMP